MVDVALPPLSEWETFYVIVGSSAAALTGLMFMVIALRTEATLELGERAVRAFGTPNVLHFCGVLLIAAILSIPHHTVTSLALCVGAMGIAGLVHVALPLVGYATVAAAAPVLPRWPSMALDMVAAAALLLLFIGIHNAWDSAVWISARRR